MLSVHMSYPYNIVLEPAFSVGK